MLTPSYCLWAEVQFHYACAGHSCTNNYHLSDRWLPYQQSVHLYETIVIKIHHITVESSWKNSASWVKIHKFRMLNVTEYWPTSSLFQSMIFSLNCLHLSMHSNTELKLMNIEQTLAVSGTRRNLFPLFVAMPLFLVPLTAIFFFSLPWLSASLV